LTELTGSTEMHTELLADINIEIHKNIPHFCKVIVKGKHQPCTINFTNMGGASNDLAVYASFVDKMPNEDKHEFKLRGRKIVVVEEKKGTSKTPTIPMFE